MEERQTLAHEIYTDLKRTCRRRKRVILLLSAVLILFAAIAAAGPARIRAVQSGGETAHQRVMLKEFTEPECERFRQLCNFTEEERRIFDLRVKGHYILDIQMKLEKDGIYLSDSTIKRRLKSIKKKIIRVM